MCGVQAHGIRSLSALSKAQSQLELARHFGVAPETVHDALADTQTLRNLWPYLLRGAGKGGVPLTVDELLASGTTAVGLLQALTQPTEGAEPLHRAMPLPHGPVSDCHVT